MEVKKTKEADLERKRFMFLQIGLVVALGASLVAFEWKTIRQNPGVLVDNSIFDNDEEMIPVIREKEPEVEQPKPKQIVLEELLIVDDEYDLPEEELEINSESLEDMSIALEHMGEQEEDTDPIPFFAVSDKPEFPGGEKALRSFLASSVRYPVIAAENGIEGTVYLSFVISETGQVEKVSILRGVDANLDREALRVVSGMPDWKPGKQGTRAVPVSYQVPIKFALR
ncbi:MULTISPECIES: energy transducer TonB [unclassified Saccharicrinis]|uniref:energy transducer TonB n=1 Tax=unclassified Saccharicrinis TaxID=2646859 RepID=UPI003D35797D